MFAPSGGKNALCRYLRDLSPSPALFRTHFMAFVWSQKEFYLKAHLPGSRLPSEDAGAERHPGNISASHALLFHQATRH